MKVFFLYLKMFAIIKDQYFNYSKESPKSLELA